MKQLAEGRRPDFGFVDAYHNDRIDLINELYRGFKLKGVTFAVYTGSSYTQAVCERAGIPVVNVHRRSRKELGQALSFPMTVGGYHFDSIDELIDVERRYHRFPRPLAGVLRARARRYFEASSAIAMEGRLPRRAMVSRPGAEIIRLALMSACEAQGTPFVFFGAFPANVGDQLFFHDDLWHTIKRRPGEALLPPVRLNQAAAPKSASAPYRYDAGLEAQSTARRLITVLRDRDFERIGWAVTARAYRNVAAPLRTAYLRRHWQPVPSQAFVFVPLNTNNDAQITLRNRRWLDQVDFVSEVTAATPEHLLVAVKFHPGPEGLLPLRSLQRLMRLPRTVILRTDLSAPAIAQRSEAVVLINSTAGLEAVLEGAPVISFGNWNMPAITGIHRVLGSGELRRLLNRLGDLRRFYVSDTRADFAELTRHMYPGNVYSSTIDGDRLCGSLITFVEELPWMSPYAD